MGFYNDGSYFEIFLKNNNNYTIDRIVFYVDYLVSGVKTYYLGNIVQSVGYFSANPSIYALDLNNSLFLNDVEVIYGKAIDKLIFNFDIGRNSCLSFEAGGTGGIYGEKLKSNQSNLEIAGFYGYLSNAYSGFGKFGLIFQSKYFLFLLRNMLKHKNFNIKNKLLYFYLEKLIPHEFKAQRIVCVLNKTYTVGLNKKKSSTINNFYPCIFFQTEN